MTFAHIAGIPVEESVLMFAPVLPLLVLGVRTRVSRIARRLTRSRSA
ncbi:MAG TPA: hypothetical protein VH418_14405 [Solirubrobacteraceae bacterium]